MLERRLVTAKGYVNHLLGWFFIYGVVGGIVYSIVSAFVQKIFENAKSPVINWCIAGILLLFSAFITIVCLELAMDTVARKSIITYKSNIKKILTFTIIIFLIARLFCLMPTIINTENEINKIQNTEETEGYLFNSYRFAIHLTETSENITFDEAKIQLITTTRISAYLATGLVSALAFGTDILIVLIFMKKRLTEYCIDD